METLATTRTELHRVATHVLARRRHAVSGRFGLCATPGGIGTPAFGRDHAIEVVRTSGGTLVHEVDGQARSVSMVGASLGRLADFVGVDLVEPFSVGRDTPEVGEIDAPLDIEPTVATELAGWYDLGWRALDAVAAGHGARPTVQLWPEHFDAGTILVTGSGPNDQVNVGVSPGDHHHDEPYLYVQPWTDVRPGDAAYWNISFGAVASWRTTRSVDAAVGFFREGVARLSS